MTIVNFIWKCQRVTNWCRIDTPHKEIKKILAT